ncbi:GH92 family glycosyl hydrolase [Barnesiella sp. ET7]|uniref:GH92 family glycosyl hydrolase n=1 Tax=Barnesiella sp. ET7 TaxID=2972460 RepID=UPI0021ACAE11|nr:GH92 family glycosyl hydrolase [Barnesiella sp. ET7]MCR8912869.1 GH92 family glycosyl hydrolase [Barnesiella sp. ET7]
MRILAYLTLAILITGCSSTNQESDYVNTFIGTGGHGHTFLGVSTPFGGIQVGPNNFNKGWDWCSGYHFSDSILVGFSHLHLNGTGCSDTGDIIFMPYTGVEKTQLGQQDDITDGYASLYSKGHEQSDVSRYKVLLETYGIDVELTSSDRVAFHKYKFPADSQNKFIMINLKDANGDDRVTESFLEQVNDTVVRGYRFSTGWAKAQQIYFTAIFSEPVGIKLYDDTCFVEGKSLKNKYVKGNVSLQQETTDISIKVGISPVSMENAYRNINQEIPHWNFERTVSENRERWNEELSKVKIETPDDNIKTIFYTSLYHAFLQPIIFNDCNNDYRGTDKKVYNSDFTNYTVFSLWDTYRAAHPLYTILQQERVPDFINSMLKIYEQQGRLPVWHLYGSDTNEMIGIQSVPVIADAILKGFEGFDHEEAYKAMKESMLSDYKGLQWLKELGYIPADKEIESVAKGLEYAIADWGISQVSKKLGKADDYEYFNNRAKGYVNYWDNGSKFFRGRRIDGSWEANFDPVNSTHRNDAYCEGNAWQYLWLVPHDVDGLISLMGGREGFISKLDSLFILDSDLGENASPDISGLIGQYAHGNEPSHHIAYLYAFAGEQWKTAEKIDYILHNLYKNAPDGLQGNEDCGQMSAWYVFSALGFYPVNPSDGKYVFGRPIIDKATIKLDSDKTFTITVLNNSMKNKYIQSVKLNGKNYNKFYINHADIMHGGELTFEMGEKPNKTLFSPETQY